MILSCSLEMTSAFAGSVSVKYFSCYKIIQFSMFCLSISFSIFSFAPPSLKDVEFSQAIFFIVCMLFCKICNDNLFLIVYLYMPKVLTEKFVGFYIILSRFFARFFTLFLPTISYQLRKLGIHPFVFYGSIWFFYFILFFFIKDVQNASGGEEFLKEKKLSFIERASIASEIKSDSNILSPTQGRFHEYDENYYRHINEVNREENINNNLLKSNSEKVKIKKLNEMVDIKK